MLNREGLIRVWGLISNCIPARVRKKMKGALKCCLVIHFHQIATTISKCDR